MIDFIWLSMILVSLVFSVANGNVGELTNSIFTGAETAVTLSIGLLGAMSFWLGITEIAQKSGVTQKINKLLDPVINMLFPKLKNRPEIKEKICLNISANLLGLGNAATPLGIDAINSMSKLDDNSDLPSKEIILFVLINTASLQILPTHMADLRVNYGSENPFAILVPVWVVSFTVLLSVIVLAKIIEKSSGFVASTENIRITDNNKREV